MSLGGSPADAGRELSSALRQTAKMSRQPPKDARFGKDSSWPFRAGRNTKRRAAAAPGTASGSETPGGSTAPIASEPGDIELRLSPLYGAIVVAAGLIFTDLGLGRFGKAGPTFYTACLVAGLLVIPIGIVLLRRRPVIVRMTSSALHLQGVAIPWTDIRSLERIRDRRNSWIGVHLKIPRTDLDAAARKARAVLQAMRSPGADLDYVALETDLPRTGPWFIEECQRRIAAATAAAPPTE